ncbi:MAG: hypothetical protein ACMXYF_01645 [Candidatus Woesearchaeota archaeon]
MAKMKKRLTQHEEFELFKVVFDKLLLVGLVILGLGFYKLTVDPSYLAWQGLGFLISGFVILALLIFLLIREFEIIR